MSVRTVVDLLDLLALSTATGMLCGEILGNRSPGGPPWTVIIAAIINVVLWWQILVSLTWRTLAP